MRCWKFTLPVICNCALPFSLFEARRSAECKATVWQELRKEEKMIHEGEAEEEARAPYTTPVVKRTFEHEAQATRVQIPPHPPPELKRPLYLFKSSCSAKHKTYF